MTTVLSFRFAFYLLFFASQSRVASPISKADSLLVMLYPPVSRLLAAGLVVLNMLRALAGLLHVAGLLISKTTTVFFLVADLTALRSVEALVVLMTRMMKILTELLPDADLKAQIAPGGFLLDMDSVIVKTLKSLVHPQVGSVMIRIPG